MGRSFEIVKKLSVRKVLGKKPKAPDEGKTEWLVQFVGVASGTKTGNTDFGDWTALTGAFQALNMETGVMSRSGVCFLPDVALNLILPALEQKDIKGIEFAFNIGVKYDKDSATGYVYVAEPILEAAENDPLEMLTKKLPAPKGEKAAPNQPKKTATA